MQLLRRLSFTMLLMSLMTLVACGDGDGDLLGGNDDDTTPDAITLSIVKDTEGDLSLENDISLTATVLQGGGALANKTVTFTLAVAGTATFDPVAGTATTDANGNASIIVKVSDIEGSVNVIATHESASADISFNSLGDGIKVVEGEPEAASIQLFASSPQIASSGAQTIDLFAIAKDQNNILLEGVTINFATSSGALQYITAEGDVGSNVTGNDGKVTAQLTTEGRPSNRTITITVTSGDITDTVDIEVVGTTVVVTGTSSLALNDKANYIVNVLDSDGNGIAGTSVNISLANTPGNGFADISIPETVTTDAEGQALLEVTGSTGGSNGIVVSALGASASKEVSVQADSFLFTNFSNSAVSVNPSNTPALPDVALVQTASATLTWLRDGLPVPDGKQVTFTTTRGTLSATSATTVDGQVTVSLTSNNAGQALLTFVGSDTTSESDIELTNQLEFEFFADTVATIKAQASPSSLGPNEQTSSISVVVKDINGNLVKNKRIKFVLNDISGGSIFPATAVTDSNGSATTVYTSQSTSAKDAVEITAIVEDSPTITDNVNLTVSERELFISLGTGNELEELGTSDYIKEYSVFVTDAESNAVANVNLTISALPHKYYKGYWFPLFDGDEFIRWVTRGADGLEVSVGLTPPATTLNLPPKECDNEDVNFDGILDVGEDFNGDLMLTPGNKVSAQSTVTTDADGRAVIRIIYAQSYAEWLDIRLIASTKVTGSESSTQTIFTLPVLASDVNNEDITPPVAGIGLRGPFGLLNTCSLNISQDPKLDGT
ncbi:Ig-like domain-containing protein [Colwelliaceae bacterium MEBiC 14330]